MLSTKIVEIPVDGGFDSNSINFDAFDAFDDYFFNSNKPNPSTNQLTQANLANHQPLQPSNLIHESDVTSNASSNSFFGFDDYNSNFLSDDDPSFLQSSLDLDVPTSPVMDALSKNFNGLRRPSMEDIPTLTQKEINKYEKVEQAEDSSDCSEPDEIETNPLLIKKALNTSQTITDDSNDRANGKKRIKLGHNSPNSISSYSSESDLEEEESDAEISDDISEEEADASDEDSADSSGGKLRGSESAIKKYKLPVSLRAENLHIGNWSLKRDDGSQAEMSLQGHNISELTLDVKILFGRKKIKYELITPTVAHSNNTNKNSKSKSLLAIDFTFASISGIWFNSENREIIFQLNEPPTFTKKEKGRSSRTSDFTDGNAIRYCKHVIYVESDLAFADFQDRLLSCDKRLRQLSKLPLTDGSPTFPKEHIFRLMGRGPVCDWDKENPAIKRCEDCAANYCAVCDDVLHRHENRKNHSRVPVVIKPPQPPRARRTPPKKRKKMNSDRCRCGTGATKGTLGEPCTGNRCPCFSNGKNCANCGCKNCANPIKVNKKDQSFSPKLGKPVAVGRSGRAGGVRANSSGENLIF